jgi:hypothetical protein
MGRRFESEIADIKSRFGINLDELKADEIENLVLACRRCDSPFSSVNVACCENPVRVCEGVYLHPMTAGAQIWLEEYASAWWPKGSMYKWAQVYALAHARDPEAFVNLTDKWKARKAILKTMLRFACHRAELAEAMHKAYGCTRDIIEKDSKETQKAQSDFAAMVALLEVKSGISAKEWLWGKSFLSLAKAYTELHRFADAFSFGGRLKKRMTDELDEALNDLARVKVAIARRIKAEREQKKDE